MAVVDLEYAHSVQSLEPSRLKAWEIWRIAETARRQMCRFPNAARLEVTEFAQRSRSLSINGINFETHWEYADQVHDERGDAVFGSIEVAPTSRVAQISLNPVLIAGRDDLWRSTAAHELGHAVFDVPAWMHAATSDPNFSKRVLMRARDDNPRQIVIDWTEWRASEFMGAFLAPRWLLAKHVQRKAVELGLPLTLRSNSHVPVLDDSRCAHEATETLVLELAELFGLSPMFIQMRLRKYRLVDPV